MRHSKRLRIGLFLGVGIGAALLAFAAQAGSILRSQKLSTVDIRFALRGAEAPPDNIVVVGIDDTTFSDLRTRRPFPYTELVHGETDSEHFFALITKRIDEHGGDVAAGIGAAAREVAAEIPLLSINIIVATADELWALRYPETNELWILERSLGLDPGIASEDRLASGIMRVQSRELSFFPTTVIASQPMDASPGWRLLESGELVHVDSQLRVTSTLAVPDLPAHLMQLSELSEREAVSQGLTGTHRIS